MCEEQKNNNWKPVSRALLQAITTTVGNGRQIILLLNRRGFSTVLLCQECSFTAECPYCSVSMRYHRAEALLKCHICGFEQTAPDTCPRCGGSKIKYQGTGIQKIEHYLHEELPEVRIIRMDQDSTRKKGAHAALLHQFARREADILLGTQMVAKGLDFPGVALVGVIGADTGLHLPDFRAAERTFQLLTQVAGRAGRVDSLGEVIIQTYNPDEDAIRFAASHDYVAFYEHEHKLRLELGYPPFGRLARIVVEGKKEYEVQQYLYRISALVKQLPEMNQMKMLGPAPAALERIADESRYAILLKAADTRILNRVLTAVRNRSGKRTTGLRCIIDVDPVNML
jgi:primosomal protein N' (replication factor Y)